MRTRCVLTALTTVVSLAGGCAAESPPPAVGSGDGVPAAGSVRLTLEPTRPAFTLTEARSGNVSLVARFENLGEAPILLAHPGICVPRRPEEGETLTVDPERSFLSLRIETAAGETLRFRNAGLRFFAPGNRDHLDIASGTFEEAHVGWLGPYFALGQWAGIDRPIFDAPGTYRLTLTYRNTLPVAALTRPEGRPSWAEVWMGEIASDEAVVEIE